MFTGIIQQVGIIKQFNKSPEGAKITVLTESPFFDDAKLGDSIAINGICLTITKFDNNNASFDAMPETVSKTTMNEWKEGLKVNLEKALSPTDKMGGHFVQGHIDGVGILKSLNKQGNSTIFEFELPKELLTEIVKKGSIAINGISLTVINKTDSSFSVGIIPTTINETTLGLIGIGDKVNIETDIIGKYIIAQVRALTVKDKKDISMEFLEENGFM